MDLAKILVRSVVRAFYETQHIVIVDALVNHSALSVADLALVMDLGSTSQKIAQRLCGKLREGGLVSVYVRQEIKEGAMKPTNKEYFYIDYRRAIDATKYRIHMLDERVKQESKPTQEKKELRCPTCAAEYTTMEVLDSRDSFNMGSGFTCKRCGSVLKVIPREGDAVQDQDDTPAKFNKQFGAILSLLQQIDNAHIPPSTGEEALAAQLPLPRDRILNPGSKSTAITLPAAKPTAVRGMTSGPEKLDINITDDASVTAAEQAAAAAHREKLAQQNILPVWHTESTVARSDNPTVQQTATPDTPTSAAGGVAIKDEDDEERKVATGDATLDEYFASLKAEQERANAEGSGSEDEDDEDEFEDVIGPGSSSGAAVSEPSNKKIKLEENGQRNGNGAVVSAPVISAPDPGDDGSGSEDEDEFEDAI